MDFWRDTHIQSIARFNIIHSYFKFSACSTWVFSRSSSVDCFVFCHFFFLCFLVSDNFLVFIFGQVVQQLLYIVHFFPSIRPYVAPARLCCDSILIIGLVARMGTASKGTCCLMGEDLYMVFIHVRVGERERGQFQLLVGKGWASSANTECSETSRE